MKIRDRKIIRKRNKAQRNLEKMLNHYSHNNLVMQLQIGSYIHKFCKDKYGRINPDIYIQNYVERLEDKQREIAE